MEIHIGKLILDKIKERGMKKSEFARRINKSRQNVQDIFKRKSVDTNLLADVSNVLDFDFFSFLAVENKTNTPSNVLMEEQGVYKNIKVDKQKIQIDNLTKELKLAQKEIAYLKKINGLLEKKIENKKK